MKKYIYVIASVAAMSFTACDPMEDVYNELDEKLSNEYEADIKTELSAKDYELFKGKGTAPAYVASEHYFADEEQASELIPIILDKNFPQVGNKTKAAITYNNLVFKFGDNTVSSVKYYTLEDEDYALGGARYTSFDKEAQVTTFLSAKYPDAEEGTLALLTYTWYNGSAEPRYIETTDSYYFTNGMWLDAYHVSGEDYVEAGRNRFNNFTAADDNVLADHFNRFLNKSIVGNETNDVKYVSYAYYNGSKTVQQVMAMVFNGVRWVAVEGDVVTKEVLRFEKKGTKWVADRSISYGLVAADYAWIADQANISSESNRANLAKYGNFNTFSWSSEDILFAMSELLKSKFPNAAVGQKFTVTYDSYPGGLVSVILIKREEGNFTPPKDGE
ncbi:hypothetical protein [Pontibacter oryzae]|uniref:DUF5017 domain-containing protein n=1 Tax=Pontibacter oryzae TaxID=2304593 RepID=A0A399SL58_9BACT|nr:hypothetical protein [Pontibacter oryzae]RIJ42972.1 hypothetical protein D1627_03810 [Pontibacter oryzae]